MNIPNKTILLTVILYLLTACSATPEEKEAEQLDNTMRFYEHSLRWQDYDAVIALHKNELSTLTPEKRKYLRRFRVTSYDVVYSQFNSAEKTATQVVEIKYYNTDYAIVRDLTLKNEWRYDEKALQWYLSNPFPPFK